MIVTERDFAAQKEYYKDQMRAAERYHLARQARAGRADDGRLYSKALAWLGRRLAAWKSPPRERYDAVVSSAVPQPQ